MKAEATAENRPAYLVISGGQDSLLGPTHKYQGRVEVVVVFLVKITIIFVDLFPELLMESCAWVWLLLGEC